MAADLVLKVDFEGDLRRFRLKAGEDEVDTWNRLLQAVRSGFELPVDCGVTLKYKDDEGDLCTLARGTLADCISQAAGGPLKLFASRGPAGAQQPAALEEIAAPASGPSNPHAQPRSPQQPAQEQPQQRPQRERQPRQQQQVGVAAEASPVPPPGLDDGDDAFAEDPASDAGGFIGCRGVGPWKLLACLGSLQTAGKMSASMVASLMLQFLPILAQRAHRKQEKLNRVGAQSREMLLPVLHRVLLQLDAIEGADSVKSALNGYLSGQDCGKLGDCVSALLKLLAAQGPTAAVAQLLKGVGEEMLDLLPRSFPEMFRGLLPAVAQHEGTRCAGCGTEPILGPRFRNSASSIDLCGECFIDFAFEASTKFDCHLAAPGCSHKESVQMYKAAYKDHCRAWKDHLKEAASWKDLAGEWAGFGQAWKDGWKPWWPGKGKGKGKWKGFGKDWWCKGKDKGYEPGMDDPCGWRPWTDWKPCGWPPAPPPVPWAPWPMPCCSAPGLGHPDPARAHFGWDDASENSWDSASVAHSQAEPSPEPSAPPFPHDEGGASGRCSSGSK